MSNRNPFARRMRDDARRDDTDAAPAAPGLLNGQATDTTAAIARAEIERRGQARAEALRATTATVRDRHENTTEDQP